MMFSAINSRNRNPFLKHSTIKDSLSGGIYGIFMISSSPSRRERSFYRWIHKRQFMWHIDIVKIEKNHRSVESDKISSAEREAKEAERSFLLSDVSTEAHRVDQKLRASIFSISASHRFNRGDSHNKLWEKGSDLCAINIASHEWDHNRRDSTFRWDSGRQRKLLKLARLGSFLRKNLVFSN